MNIITLIPLYKNTLDSRESYSVDHSIESLAGREIAFICPNTLDTQYYTTRYGQIPFIGFPPACFESVHAYSRLLLSQAFYQYFMPYEFMLILQTDAIVLRDDLNFWCEQPFDYVGAPWPNRYELFVNAGRFDGAQGHKVSVTVGNGGLSLRRTRKCLALLEEFADIVSLFDRTGSSEDLFFSVMGALSEDFIVPNEITASRFAMELQPAHYYAINGGKLPMGGHAWWQYDPAFWMPHLRHPIILE